jgi:2-keto-4-pentenoate hydratase/2-oxohepta-3-ene-1,7-dioic acid hydratase in catechol pathway
VFVVKKMIKKILIKQKKARQEVITMRFIRYEKDGEISHGIIEKSGVKEVATANLYEEDDSGGKQAFDVSYTGRSFARSEIHLIPPCQPTKIVAVGLNYQSHAQELNMQLPDEPLLFLKPSTSVIGHEGYISYPPMSRRVDYEAELGVVIGRVAKSVSVDEAKSYILGYTCFNDVTARDLQGKDKQFTRSKSFDTFAPVGPWIETDLDPTKCKVESFLNGKLKQSGNTSDLVFPVFYLVSFISEIMTLLPGDIIATGTPSGIGPMKVGDTVEVKIEGIGTLRNQVSNPYRP